MFFRVDTSTFCILLFHFHFFHFICQGPGSTLAWPDPTLRARGQLGPGHGSAFPGPALGARARASKIGLGPALPGPRTV